MSYELFIPTVESANFLKDLQAALVFGVDCNQNFDGAVKKIGDSVTFFQAGSPTVYSVERNTTGGGANNSSAGTGKQIIQENIGDAETIENTEFTLYINQISYFHYYIGDIDKEEIQYKNVIDGYREESARKVAKTMDKYIAKVMAENAEKWNATAQTVKHASETLSTNEVHPCGLIDDLVLKMNDNDVDDSTPLVMEVSPKFWKYLKEEYRDLDTDNSSLLANRRLGIYNDVTIKKTTGCYNVGGTTDEYVFIRTKRAVGFANPMAKTEKYRPEKAFSDAVKGFTLYDCAIMRPKEVLAQKVSY